jgi:hypothetical protein
MFHNSIYAVIDWAALPSLAVLALLLFVRKYHRDYPLFFAYVVVADVIGISRLWASRLPLKFYFYVYYISDIAIVVFAFLAIYELFIQRLFPAFYKVRFFRYLFPAAALVITMVGAGIAAYSGNLSALMITERVYEFARAAVLFFFVTLMVVMGRSWNKQQFGVALGFGFDVAATFAALAFLMRYGYEESARRIPAAAYDLACFVWLYCFWPARQIPAPPANQLRADHLHEAKKWEEAVKDLLRPDKG